MLTPNTEYICIQTKDNSEYQQITNTNILASKSEVRYRYATRLTEFGWCGSEVNTESCDKEQTSYLDKFQKYGSTTLIIKSYSNNINIVPNKINDFDTWESLHSIISSSSETYRASGCKKITKRL